MKRWWRENAATLEGEGLLSEQVMMSTCSQLLCVRHPSQKSQEGSDKESSVTLFGATGVTVRLILTDIDIQIIVLTGDASYRGTTPL